MVELHLSLRFSEYFATTATVRMQAGVVIAVFMTAARLLVRVILAHVK